MVRFDRYEEDRMYLGFTEFELGVILTTLEKHLPDGEITRRIDALAMRFSEERRKKNKLNSEEI